MKRAWRKRFAINDTRFLDLLPLLVLPSEFLLKVAAAETEQKKATIQTILGAK